MNLLSFRSPDATHCCTLFRGFHASTAAANTGQDRRKRTRSRNTAMETTAAIVFLAHRAWLDSVLIRPTEPPETSATPRNASFQEMTYSYFYCPTSRDPTCKTPARQARARANALPASGRKLQPLLLDYPARSSAVVQLVSATAWHRLMQRLNGSPLEDSVYRGQTGRRGSLDSAPLLGKKFLKYPYKDRGTADCRE